VSSRSSRPNASAPGPGWWLPSYGRVGHRDRSRIPRPNGPGRCASCSGRGHEGRPLFQHTYWKMYDDLQIAEDGGPCVPSRWSPGTSPVAHRRPGACRVALSLRGRGLPADGGHDAPLHEAKVSARRCCSRSIRRLSSPAAAGRSAGYEARVQAAQRCVLVIDAVARLDDGHAVAEAELLETLVLSRLVSRSRPASRRRSPERRLDGHGDARSPLRDRIALVHGQLPGYRAGHRAPAGADGARVVVHCRGNREAARLTAEEIASLGPRAGSSRPGGGRPQPERTSAACSRVSPNVIRLDCLVSNAAMGGFGPLLSSKPHIWSLTRRRALGGPVALRPRGGAADGAGGRIVAISSTGSRRHVRTTA